MERFPPWPAPGPQAPPPTALPARNTNKGPSRCTEKATRCLTAPRGQLDRAGIQGINGTGQPIMAQLLGGHQTSPLLQRVRDEGRRWPAEEVGGPRLPSLMA